MRALALGMEGEGCLCVRGHWTQWWVGVALQTLSQERGVDPVRRLCTHPTATPHPMRDFLGDVFGCPEGSLGNRPSRTALLSLQGPGSPPPMTQRERLMDWLSDRGEGWVMSSSAVSSYLSQWLALWNLVERSSEQVWRCLVLSLIAKNLLNPVHCFLSTKWVDLSEVGEIKSDNKLFYQFSSVLIGTCSVSMCWGQGDEGDIRSPSRGLTSNREIDK